MPVKKCSTRNVSPKGENEAKPRKQGYMIAGKNLINTHKDVIVKNKFDPETMEMVYVAEKKGFVERLKTA